MQNNEKKSIPICDFHGDKRNNTAKPILTDYWTASKRSRICHVASLSIRPPEDIEVDEWAETNVVLSHRVSSRSGRLRLEPYQRRYVRMIKHCERIVLIWAAQSGKTIILQIFMGWAIDQYHGPMMVCCPDQPFAKRRSRKHLQPFITDSPALQAHIPGNRHDLSLYEFTLDTMSVTVAWAGSPSQMAGEPIMLLARDEFDKYPDATDKEANAFRLVERRTSSYDHLRKIVDATTPTVRQAEGWKALLGGTYEELFIPCPHCAPANEPFTDGQRNPGWQRLEFRQFRYPRREGGGDDPEELCDWQARIRSATHYECIDCNGRIDETQRWGCVTRGEWVARHPDAPYISSHLPSWYTRTSVNSFGEVAARYVEGLEDPAAMQDWKNNDAAEPYEQTGHNATEDLIVAHMSDYAQCHIPTTNPCLVIATADLHKLVHYVTVWALTADRSYLIECRKVEDVTALGAIRRETVYLDPDGREYHIDAMFPDAEYRTHEVYNLALDDDAITPITGGARAGLISWTTATHYPRSDKQLDKEIHILNVCDEKFKNDLLNRFESGLSETGFDIAQSDWILPEDTPREFIRHMMGEVARDMKNSRGYTSRTWDKVGPNHYLDCAKYMLAARHVLTDNLRHLNAPPIADPGIQVENTPPEGWN